MKSKLFKLHTENETDEIEFNKFLESVRVKQIFAQIVNADVPFWSVLVFFESSKAPATENFRTGISTSDKTSAAEKSKISEKPASENIVLMPQQENVFNALKRWRNEKAASEGIPPYLIAHNFSLVQIAASSVKSREDLIEIKGFGEKRAEKYGDEILGILAEQDSETAHEK